MGKYNSCTFAFVDSMVADRDEYMDNNQLPVFCVYTVATKYVGETTLTSEIYPGGAVEYPYLFEHRIGMSFCSPYDVTRYVPGRGLELANLRLARADDVQLFVESKTYDTNLPVGKLFSNFQALRFVGEHYRLPRWVRHALDLEPYLTIMQISGPTVRDRTLVKGPLAKKMFTGTTQRLERENYCLKAYAETHAKLHTLHADRIAVLDGALRTIHYGCEVALGN